jgi:hypothetical protein
MTDVYCQQCGEPWDSYGITYCVGEGDMTAEETERFKRGEGCPCCDWGTACTNCRGSGIEPDVVRCKTCHNRGYVYAKRCESARDERLSDWFIGYSNSREFPIRNVHERITRTLPDMNSADGAVNIVQMICPDCKHIHHRPCSVCDGDGKLRPRVDKMTAIASLCDASDEDPYKVMAKAGVL